jgi:ketosteroid isomerase-like protein
MSDLKAYVFSYSDDDILVVNMTELEAKDIKIKALEDKVHELETHIKLLIDEQAERKAYTGLGD